MIDKLKPVELPKAEPTGRVCAYARQQCTLEHGCPLPVRWGPMQHVASIEAAALECEHQGEALLAGEVRTRVFNREADARRPREMVRELLVARNRKAVIALNERERARARWSAKYAAGRSKGRRKASR